jgi:hypothetical protein
MRRILSLLGALLLASAMALPSAGSVLADNVGCGSGHFFLSTVSFPAGFWSEGPHHLTFAAPDFGVTFGPYTLTVDSHATLYPGQVLINPLNPPDLRLLASDGTHPTAINPGQATVVRDFWGADSQSDLVSFHNSATETLSWDDGPAVAMHFGGLSSGCLSGGPNKTTEGYWLRHYGPPLK